MFPGNRRFAFTICDDTDGGTLKNLIGVYHFLAQLGFRTTKSVWPLASERYGRMPGESLQDKGYLQFVRWLHREGFEISLHNVRNHHATRDMIVRGFEEFHTLLGSHPRVHCNHSRNLENIYWGDRRFSRRDVTFAYNVATRYAWHKYFQGDDETSPFFWGDLCRERITYVRNFVFSDINLDNINPTMPYHDPDKRYVNYWFSSSDGRDVERFCDMLRESQQDRLEAEGGVCIMYTHFANGFCRNGTLHPQFARLMKRLSSLNGWFVPVSTLLDHLRAARAAPRTIPPNELAAMERHWLLSNVRMHVTHCRVERPTA
ncbi:hypothetical protein [Candidatus Nitrospira bockiana]